MKLGGNRVLKDLALSLGEGGYEKMDTEIARAQGIAEGILAGRIVGANTNIDLATALLSPRITCSTLLSNTGFRQIARIVIESGFNNNPEEFVIAFSQYKENVLDSEQGKLLANQQAVLNQFMLEALEMISNNLRSGGNHYGYATIETAVEIRALISDEHKGKVRQLIRLCGRSIHFSVIDLYCEEHLQGPNERERFADEIRECLIEGLFYKLGFWKIWCLVRRFFLGKNPDKAEAEMKKEKEIAIVHAQLLESWRYPVNLDDPNLEKRMSREAELFARLSEIDPDNAASWFEENAPSDRRAD